MACENWIRWPGRAARHQALRLVLADGPPLRRRTGAPVVSMCAARHAGTATPPPPRRRSRGAPDRAPSAGKRIRPTNIPAPTAMKASIARGHRQLPRRGSRRDTLYRRPGVRHQCSAGFHIEEVMYMWGPVGVRRGTGTGSREVVGTRDEGRGARDELAARDAGRAARANGRELAPRMPRGSSRRCHATTRDASRVPRVPRVPRLTLPWPSGSPASAAGRPTRRRRCVATGRDRVVLS